MDFDLKQSRDHHSHPTPSSASCELPLFVSEPNSHLSAFSSDHSTRIPRMGSYFSLSQWQELELQALVFRHMIAGAGVPHELLHLVKKSLITSPFCPSQHYYPHLQHSLLQSGYWGRGAMDPEPGRCRRTDGKKWRCSRDVVVGQKYCERHMHRGKNRSRKHVETPTSATSPYGGASGGDAFKTSNSLSRHAAAEAAGDGPPQFALSSDHLHLNQRPLPASINNKTRHFFDDWPKPLHERVEGSATTLSISMPGDSLSDFSLKLGTGNGDEPSERDKAQLSWGMTWETNRAAPMGGPLAEVLRPLATNSSPTSVLHRLPRVPASEASF